jgi:phage gpG-like protein
VSIHVNVSGTGEVEAALDRIHTRVHAATRRAVQTAMGSVQEQAQVLLSLTSHPPGTATPSPPGSPPSRITGHLAGSLSPTGPVPADGGYSGRVGPSAVYARIQELGGVTGAGHRTRLPPRPYLRPSYDRVRDRIRQAFVDAWRAAL